ncbi:MAG: phosphopantetheine-binding protein [Myxococcales bacterium]|nr:phosphopantetheine-binding protein [Myxococcales bacterium]MDD9972053.1 phosphopantetheine-binding protein [Myxococcales bacterium]
MMANADRVRHVLSKLTRTEGLANDDDIFGRGFLNSLNAVQLISLIESEFGVRVEDADLDITNFRSVVAIAGFVAQKTGAEERTS